MWVRGLIALLLLAGAVLIGLGEVKPDAAPAILSLVLLAGLVVVIPVGDLRQVLSRIKKINVAGVVSADLYEDVKDLAKNAPNEDIEPKEGRAGLEDAKGNEATDLRLRLEAKLAYVAKHMLEPHTDFVTIGSLHFDKLLTDKEARTADGLMTLRDEDLQALTRKRREEFVGGARQLVKSFRASVLHGWVRATVGRKKGWRVTDLPPGERPRCDFLVSDGKRSFLVVTAFATSAESEILNSALEHISSDPPPMPVDKRIVVIPRRTATPSTDVEHDPAVVHMQDLPAALGIGP
jgi:hypothetical protein